MKLIKHIALGAVALAVVACGGAGPTASPGASPSPTPATTAPPVDGVASPAQAAALVFASDPHFAAIRPANTDLIGECCSYEAVEAPSGFQVTVNIGWGDCEAGCINHHNWQFFVGSDGTITLVGQQGSDEPAPIPTGGNGPASVTLQLRAGPTCPVVRDPPDPGCAPRPVVNTGITLRDPSGAELATGASDEQGQVQLSLPPGAYYVEPAPAEGLMGQAAPLAFSVVGGETVLINLDYDTGIR
jgi:hypothetical protein